MTVTGEGSSMGATSLIEVRISAADPAVLKKASEAVLAPMKTVESLADVTSNLSESRPSATVLVDQAKATAAGVSAATLSQYTTLVLNGHSLGTMPIDGGPLPAVLTEGQVTVPPAAGAVSDVLRRLQVPAAAGTVPLGGFLSTPLAVVVIGGLFTSTFLTLILVPVLYVALDRPRPADAYEAQDWREEPATGVRGGRP